MNTFRIHLITGKVILVKRHGDVYSLIHDITDGNIITSEQGKVIVSPTHVVFFEIV